ncbi:MAG: hypothetical protein RIQ60_1823 [Pseudomonadota bacterium]|jgi:CheY-like chemotaxis protein
MDILIVEDNPADVELVREALAESAVDVRLHWMPTGEQALAYLCTLVPHQGRRPGAHQAAHQAAHPALQLPDLVLLDLNLPGVSGGEVLKAIKSDPALLMIPVVVLTSSAARRDVQHAYQNHVNAYVVKPDNFNQFLELVATLRDYWLTHVLLPTQVQ